MTPSARPLVSREDIRLAMLGMVDGNGHPYSWSAMFNGYDPEAMAKCPFAGIPEYLNKEPKASLRIPGARVTHIWTDNPADAQHVAACSLIPHVVGKAADVIGHVDAVVVATDKGSEHVERCRPFVAAGLPVFVDKPLVDSAATCGRSEDGSPKANPSCRRAACATPRNTCPTGRLRTSSGNCGSCRSRRPSRGNGTASTRWKACTPFLDLDSSRRATRVRRTATSSTSNTCTARTSSWPQTPTCTEPSAFSRSAGRRACGSRFQGHVPRVSNATRGVRRISAHGNPALPVRGNVELMKLVIAGIRSREDGGREVALKEIE